MKLSISLSSALALFILAGCGKREQPVPVPTPPNPQREDSPNPSPTPSFPHAQGDMKAVAGFDKETREAIAKVRRDFDDLGKQLRESSGYSNQLTTLGGHLRVLVSGKPGKLTPSRAEFDAGTTNNPDLVAMVQSGELVVVWDGKPGSTVLAYPRMALEKKAKYLDERYVPKECTPESLKALLEAQK